MSRLFFKELRTLLEKNTGNTHSTSDEALASLKEWKFADRISEKLFNQLDNYDKLPTLTELINRTLEQLLPLYESRLDTGKDDFLFNHMQRFVVPASNSGASSKKALKLNNLKAHIIKHELFDEYFTLSEFRKGEVSILSNPDISEERIVHTYTDLNVLQLVRLLNDDVFLNSSYFNYYKRFSKLFFDIMNTNTTGLSKKLRPVDLEKLIQTLIYSNKKLKNDERLELKLDEINRILLNDLQVCGLKLSNKEMFALLQLTFQNTKDMNNIIDLYDKFSKSDKFEKNGDFYNNFLNVNISLGFSNERILSEEFTRRIINDVVTENEDIRVNRYLLKYLLKYSWIVRDVEMSQLVVTYMLEKYTLDTETFNMIVQGMHKYDTRVESPILQTLLAVNTRHGQIEKRVARGKSSNVPVSSELDRFNVRLLDHLLEKCDSVAPTSDHNFPGLAYRRCVNRYPRELVGSLA